MIVFAGNNGSGKSSLRGFIEPMKLNVKTHIDPDLIAKRYKLNGEKNPNGKAGRETVRLINQLIEKKKVSLTNALFRVKAQ